MIYTIKVTINYTWIFLVISKQNMLALNCDNNNNIIILFKETIHDPTQVEIRPKLSAGECSST